MSGDLDVGVLAITLGILIMMGAGLLGRRATSSAPAEVAVLEHAGAILGWSPNREVARAEAGRDRIADLAAAERAELADAAAELAPLISAEQRVLARAFRDFDAAMLGVMSTVTKWHNDGHHYCARCTGRDGKVFGRLGDDVTHIGIRAFRIDTPTAEHPLVKVAP